MKHVLGIAIPKGESFLHTWYDVFVDVGSIQPHIAAIALVTLVAALLAKRIWRRGPNLLIGMLTGSLFRSSEISP